MKTAYERKCTRADLRAACLRHLADARMYRTAAADARERCATEFGASPWPNRFPISGGVCEHWPAPSKDAVLSLVRRAQGSVDDALICHIDSGRHSRTFRRLVANHA